VKSQTEVEIKFLVPSAARAGVVAELARGAVAPVRMSLAAMYLDTPDRRLAKAGIAWRLRREGRRWVQTLKAQGSNPLKRFEHESVRRDASFSASVHAGTPAGDRLSKLLEQASADGAEAVVRFQTKVRRTTRRVRTRGAVVEIAYDEGRLLAGDASQPIREIEFELVSGSALGMLDLAERWRRRFGLIYDPRSKAERGDRLADGGPFAPLRKAARPSYVENATATEAFAAVLDECLAQVNRNAVGLIHGDPQLQVEHVHQLRVGIRRLRSAMRSFKGWVMAPPDDLVEGLRALFATLGLARDRDVLGSGVMAELAAAGAPPLHLPPGPAAPEPAQVVRHPATQRVLLGWLAWRLTLETATVQAPNLEPAQTAGDRSLQRNAARRLRRWHARLVANWQAFDELDDAGLHTLRRRIKRQRYAVEFFAPLLRRRQVERYLEALAAIQDRMGALNDAFVARSRYQALTSPDASAWFALGWLAARIAELRMLAKPELKSLVATDPPARRASG
jgi:triphosphatase